MKASQSRVQEATNNCDEDEIYLNSDFDFSLDSLLMIRESQKVKTKEKSIDAQNKRRSTKKKQTFEASITRNSSRYEYTKLNRRNQDRRDRVREDRCHRDQTNKMRLETTEERKDRNDTRTRNRSRNRREKESTRFVID